MNITKQNTDSAYYEIKDKRIQHLKVTSATQLFLAIK